MISERADLYVYLLLRENGVPFYVGKGYGDRWTRHEKKCVRNTHKDNIIRQILSRLPSLPKKKVAEGLTNAEAITLERKLIAEIGREPNGPLVNATDGGEGLPNPSPETRAKLIAERKARRYSDEQRAKMSVAQRRRTYWPKASAETKAKMSASHRGRPCSEETRRKISLAQKGVKKPPDQAARLREMGASRPMNDKWLAQIRALGKKQRGTKQSAERRARRSAAARLAGYRPLLWLSALGVAARKGRVWMTDGVESFLIHSRVPLPLNWRYGRVVGSARDRVRLPLTEAISP